MRLAGGGVRDGRVEILFRNEWGKVCDYYWTDQDAGVVCKQLGHVGGTATIGRYPASTLSKTWMYYPSCTGTESSLFECSMTWDPSFQINTCQQAEVVCYDTIRLVEGDQVSMGLVEVNFNGNWGSICDTNWGPQDTAVACRQLGYQNGLFVCCGGFGDHYNAAMDNVGCTGSESRLTDCSHSLPTSSSCSGRNVAVVCYNGTAPNTFTWRLGGGNNYTGEVMVNYMNKTGRICSDGWDDNDALVACRELGYPKGQAYLHDRSSYIYWDYSPYWTSQVACTGTELSLASCPRGQLGQVTTCTGHSAGILCTSTEGIYYRIAGSNRDNAGRVEVSVDGNWGSLCNYYWDNSEANVLCRTLGFRDGEADYSSTYPRGSGPVYEAEFNCNGREEKLEDCPHTGWQPAVDSWCTGHANDANVKCYNDVRLANLYLPRPSHGPVQVYNNGTWGLVCDKEFDDRAARRVCQDLGYLDGKAICCSAYGSLRYYVYPNTVLNFTMKCNGSETDASKCLKPMDCSSGSYASVVCFNSSDLANMVEGYTFTGEDQTGASPDGRVIVTHYGVRGHICSTFWDDLDARAYCRSKSYVEGLAYHTDSESYIPSEEIGPYWVSSMNCSVRASALGECPFKERLSLGNCSASHIASATCFNGSAEISYRLAGGAASYGRVEVSVGGVWGTVCDSYWDDPDATVLCRQLGFSAGYAVGSAFYGKGSGPVWLSRLTCKGTEENLHSCPHGGFSPEVIDPDDLTWSYDCRSHIQDASVYCVDKLRLNTGLNASNGAVEVYDSGSWYTLCDDTFDNMDAQVVCRNLGFQHGTSVGGSRFGYASGPIGFTNIQCAGTESTFATCPKTKSTKCTSNTYAGVFCSQDPIVDSGFQIRIARDNANVDYHGFLQVNVRGVWGGVCAAGFDQSAATVACKELGFASGVPYNPSGISTDIIMVANKQCTGNEQSLNTCKTAANSTNWCDYYAPRAGVICSRSSTGGIAYRISGGPQPSLGRLEMSYDGEWREMCSSYYPKGMAMVGCKSVGYKGGLMVSGSRFASPNNKYWFTWLSCVGNESSITQCVSDGFDMNLYPSYDPCSTSGPATVSCYNKVPAFTQVRLVGSSNSSGRVEVYMEGPDDWGTVCDDLWDDKDATVVCNQLGYAKGVATMMAESGQGGGHIFMDDVQCVGNETHIWDCVNAGFGIHNCMHYEDAGAECTGVYVPPTTTKSPVTDEPITEKTTGNNYQSPAAIAVPTVLVLAVLVGVGIFLYYRRFHASKLPQMNVSLVHDDTADEVGGRATISGFTARFRKAMPDGSAEGIDNPSFMEQQPERPQKAPPKSGFSSLPKESASDA